MVDPRAAHTPLWSPTPNRIERAKMTEFLRLAGSRGHIGLSGDSTKDFRALWEWSVRDRECFWLLVWEFCGILAGADRGSSMAHAPDLEGSYGLDRMAPPDPKLGPKWFPRTRLNFAENLLRFRDSRPALVFWNEEGRQRELSYATLAADAGRVAAALRRVGVQPGDRVAGFLPNIPETVIAMLGATWIGAIWSSCSPDFGVQGVLDRFGQIEPRVLFCADGYRYAGKEIDSLERVAAIAGRISSIAQVVVVPYRNSARTVQKIPRAGSWEEFLRSSDRDASPAFERLPFDHPIYVMYSSGTTGLPKCMVHGAGGTLIQHLKEHVLHTDIGRDDRVFYFTTCGWMMWNWLVSSLAVGATVVLHDGAPFAPQPSALWDMAAREKITVFGTSAKYLALCEKEQLEPVRTHDLSELRAILSTGSPLALHSFDYVYDRVKRDVHLASISGGTDLISCFALGNPITPVYRGELQTRGLGMAVDVFDDKGRSIRGGAGELVCTKPFPSMPVSFWNDSDGSKYRAAYFDHFDNVWRHGDWAEITDRDGMIIYGRSDATLNPGGVRIGTAELYRQVEQLPEVVESVAIGQEIDGDEGDVRIVLFVRLRDGLELDDELRGRIRKQIRENTSPLHVPKKIVQVADIPRTISGKISELAVRDVIHGRPVKNTEALANPQALELYRDIPELRHP